MALFVAEVRRIFLSIRVPPIFVGIAFDSGGAASGLMTATFILALHKGLLSCHTDCKQWYGFGVILWWL